MAAKLGGAKGGKYQLGQNADINVTPFVDVMLVLLIIFMVSAPLATVAIKIDLPPATTPPKDSKPPVYISIRKDLPLAIHASNDGLYPTSLATLDADLPKFLGVAQPKDQVILISAERLVRYKDFMSVVNTLQTDGYYKVAVIAQDL
jgi:biopolymer transport protein ExbD